MTVTEPLPGTLPHTYGKADWVDYTNYWREIDAEWLMQRSILRYTDTAARNAEWPSPSPGQVVYNQATNRLEVVSAVGGWATIQQYVNLTPNPQDTTLGVAISHKDSGAKGIVFEPGRVAVAHTLATVGGVLTADATGLSIKTGGATARITTDASLLVSSIGISAPSVALSGALTAASATIPTLSTTNISMTGTLSGGGVINGGSGTIGTVALAGGKVTAAAGMDTSGASFYGDGASAIVRQSNRTGPYLQAHGGGVNIGGPGLFDVKADITMRVLTNAVQYIRSDGVHTGYVGTSFWGGDPGVGNVPEGAIWLS